MANAAEPTLAEPHRPADVALVSRELEPCFCGGGAAAAVSSRCNPIWQAKEIEVSRFVIRPLLPLLALLITALVIGVHAGLSAGGRAFPRFGAGCARSDFSSAGATVRAELCSPSGSGPSPAVVVLHGCGGFSTFDHRLVAELPSFGIATLDVDFFGPTPPQQPTYIEKPRPHWVYPVTVFVVVFGVGSAGLVYSELGPKRERAVP